MSEERGTLQAVAEELAFAVEPLNLAFRDVASFRALMWRLGWDVQSLPPSYVAIADAALTAAQAAEALADEAELDEIIAVVEAVGDVYTGIDALGDTPPGVDPAFLGDLARNLFEYLLAEYLLNHVPKLFSALELFGVIRFEHVEATAPRPAFVQTRFEWERIPEALGDPASIPADVLGWGTPDFNFRKTAELLGEVTLALGLPSSVGRISSGYAQAIQSQATGTPSHPARTALTVPFFDVDVPGVNNDVGLQLVELPAEGSALPGMLLGPLLPNGIATSIPLGGGWAFDLRAGTDLAEQLGIVLRPGEIGVRYPFAPGRPLPSAGLGFGLTYAPATPGVLFGEPSGTRLELAGATLSVLLDLHQGDLELKLATQPRGLAVVLSAASLDGFLGGVLGAGETRIEAPLGIAWSNRTGLNFQAGAGFEIALYPHIDFGVLRFDRVDLAVRFQAGAGTTPRLDVRAAAAFSGALGPVSYTVDRLGIQLPVEFEPGNAGPFNIDFGVLWPTGLGLVVDVAGVVTGGGFVSLDPDAGRYVGILELALLGIAIGAVGILDTKDASGQDLPAPGFSLLIAISATFPPIQLGYGFTLNGVGGLAALNRRLDTDAFLAGVRTGAVDSVLFPEDPVRNAQTIVSNLTTIFPIAIGRYVFGPMARLGWGTPTLVKVELGVLIEVPDPFKLALVGQASIELPEQLPIVSINIDVVAILDLGRKLLALDASLRDSRVALFSLSGDMAMRLSWGDEPNFALAVGGLNPHFTPPPQFPSLRRITLALGAGENPRVSIEAYLAITSNSLQFGARAELYAEAAGFSIQGWLGFDALLIFVPLSFRFDFTAGLGLYRGQSRIAGISVEGTLTGPSPFHVWGRGCISILFIDICVPFDATFGERQENTLEPRDPWLLLQAAMQRLENWHAELAPDVAAAVALRPAAEEPDKLLLHPMGSATLRQKVLPLNRPLERFGQYEVEGPDRYDLHDVAISGTEVTGWTVVRDHFAPGDFEDLNETEKLSRPSFEQMDAGVRVAGDAVDAPLGALKEATLDYETRIVDSPWDSRPMPVFRLDRATQLATVLRGSRALSVWEGTGPAKFAPAVRGESAVWLGEEEYAVASLDTLSSLTGAVGTKGAAYRARKQSGGGRDLQVVPSHELAGGA